MAKSLNREEKREIIKFYKLLGSIDCVHTQLKHSRDAISRVLHEKGLVRTGGVAYAKSLSDRVEAEKRLT